MFITKWSPSYRQAVRQSRAIASNNKEAMAEAGKAAAKRSAGREVTASCAGDGMEHSVHQHTIKPVGYWRLFCAHERPRWTPCGMCRRNKVEAQANWDKLQRGELR